MSYINNIFDLENKTAVIIGGKGVLGSAMADGLGRAGCKLALLSPSVTKHDPNVQKLSATKKTFQCNVQNRAELEHAADRIVETWGEPDILVNAAGINSTTPFFDITEEEYEKIINVNLKGTFLACQVFGKHFQNAGKPASIINISSVTSITPLSKVFSYGVSKAGINNLTQFLASEWAKDQIRVNAIVPGFFPAKQNRKILTTERVNDIMRHTPMQRFGEPEELIGAVLWLASEKASSFVTGAVIPIDGGFTAMTI